MGAPVLRAPGRQAAARPPWKAGVATVDITPASAIWMAGYAARKTASQGTALPLHAKALALEDGDGRRSVLVTLDLLGITDRLARRVAEQALRAHDLPRERLLFNASHTHSGPVLDDMLSVAYDLTDEQRAAIAAYSRDLEPRLTRVIADALARLQPAHVGFGQGEATFAANRRVQFTPDGPVDHAVPILRVDAVPADAKTGAAPEPLAIVFGYACHNTTLQADVVQFHGDYAGVAQAVLERRHPGTTAMFVSGCGADQNPKPRGTMALVEQHGVALADAIDRAMPSPLDRLAARLSAHYATVDLPFATPPDRDGWKAKLQDADQYVRRHARLMLDALDRDGKLPAAQAEPIQIWRFAGGPTLVALGGEVVVDYALRLRKDYPDRPLWIAGYSNDVFGYVPSSRVLKEGGYEGGGAMIYYGRPGAFAPPVEDLIHETIHRLMPLPTPVSLPSPK